jgi:hypothetical protein
MATMLENLGREMDALDNEYAANFAGQSRLTRDIGLLDSIIERGNDLLKRINSIPAAAQGPDLVKLKDAASNNIRLYAQERGAIIRAQEVGPTFEAFSNEATAANLIFGRYARHFAGKDRTTRDLAFLGELVDDLKQIEKRMTQLLEEHHVQEFTRDREVVVQNLVQYQKEIGLIENAQKSGTPEERASVLASLANSQFNVYQTHFAGEPRVSRRPALLMRIIASLKSIRERMIGFRDGGLDLEFNNKNIGIVDGRLETYEKELVEIRKVRQSTQMVDIMGELGNAANKLFDQYRSAFADKARSAVDLDLLAALCDKLGEIRRQMTDLQRAEDNEMNNKNLDIVTEQLVMFEGEFEAVTQAKAASNQTTGGSWAKSTS